MTRRARRPTDDVATEIRDPGLGRGYTPRPAVGPVTAADPATPAFESFEDAATHESVRPRRAAVEQATPEPIRVISMKDAAAPRPRADEHRAPLHVQLRSLAEAAGRHDTPVGMGRLAPPRDPREVRARRRRDNVVWASVAIGLACAIAIVVWLVAGR